MDTKDNKYLLLNMYSRLSTASTIVMLDDDSSVMRWSTDEYRCRENECSTRRVVK